jgi:hypothetical protein
MHRVGCRPSTVCASARRHIFEYEEGPGSNKPRLSFSSIHQVRGRCILRTSPVRGSPEFAKSTCVQPTLCATLCTNALIGDNQRNGGRDV